MERDPVGLYSPVLDVYRHIFECNQSLAQSEYETRTATDFNNSVLRLLQQIPISRVATLDMII
jgi:hypothetical protein